MQRSRWWGGFTLVAGIVLMDSSRAAPPDPVQSAIERGVKALQTLRPFHPFGGSQLSQGLTALWGLTLLECGVPAADPNVHKAARELRRSCEDMTMTYPLSLTILFLDRLGDPADKYVIQTLALRLLNGQRYALGWSYDCPRPTAQETQLLTSHLHRAQSHPQTIAPSNDLPGELREQHQKIEQQLATAPSLGLGDNSNTQFALMALWAARRHGVPVDSALARAAERFRKSQNSDGGWGYLPGDTSTAAMTCVGVLALAMNHAAIREAALRGDPNRKLVRLGQDPIHGPPIQAALTTLGTAFALLGDGRGLILTKGYYALWSLERMAVACGLQTLGKRDWHAWGCRLLVANQGADGLWRGEHTAAFGPAVDSCFALLFLRQANLTRDLTATLKGQVEDPAEIVLKGGGVGGAGLLGQKLSTGLAFGDKPAEPGLPSQLDAEAVRLCRELLQARGEQQRALLDRLKEGKGTVHTDALAAAIPHLDGTTQRQARDALAERLTRMTTDTLRGKLAETDVEVRVAAIQACVNKDARGMIPDLIPLLNDASERVARAAHKALQYLSGEDFGPVPGATAVERERAMTAWKAWWHKQANP